ncbi:MAG: hypothetical protein JNM47_08455 [Hyphomonadaceae bacterium]|nr:hypothetical protein [Hyphomonadaceae bacterium]
MLRFVLLRWTPVDRVREAEARRMADALTGPTGETCAWSVIVDWRGVLLLVRAAPEDVAALTLSQGRGAIFGALFTVTGARATDMETRETGRICAGGGEALFRDYWGGFVAVLIDRGYDLVHVLRDPSGHRHAHYAQIGAVHVVFSHAEDFAALGGALLPDCAYLAAFLKDPGVASARTGLKGVTLVQPGERFTFSRETVSRDTLWRPQDFAPARRRAGGVRESAADAAMRLSSSVTLAVRAWGTTARRAMVRLSGGLDSSIVLACLAQEGAPDTCEVLCVNEYARDVPEGDERQMARAAAARWGREVIEVEMTPAAVDYARVLEAPLFVSPTTSLLGFANTTLLETAHRLGVDFVASGQAGDHLFHRSRSPLIAADAVWLGETAREVGAIVEAVARLTGRSIWAVAWVAALHGLARAPLLRARAGSSRASAGDALERHPWLATGARQPPAQALRVAHLLDAVRYQAPGVLNTRVRSAPVLLSQPVIETCLSIPAYVMTHGGRERGLVRDAFASRLSPSVAARTTKGETTRFFAAVVSRNLAFMRAVLHDGELRRLGLLDDATARRLLASDTVSDGAVSSALMVHLAAELWLRRLRRGAEAQAARAALSG